MDYKKLAEAALEKRASLVNEVRALDSDSTLSDSDKAVRIERINADILAVEAEARSFVEQGEREAEFRTLAERAGGLLAPVERRAEENGRDLEAELRAVARGEVRGIELNADASIEHRIATTGTAANAGTLIDTTFVAQILESLRENSPIVRHCRVITTERGEKMEWPVKNGRLTANRLAENTVYTKTDMSFSRTDLDAFKYGVFAEATVEMLNDSSLPLAGLIATDMGEALADATALDFLTGTGTGQPQGLLTGLTLNVAGGTIANTLTFDNLIKLQHAIIPKYRANALFYTSDAAILSLRQVKDADGRYIYQDAVTVGAPATLLGKAVEVDVNMPAPTAASSKIVVFGDLKKAHVVRFVRGVEVARSDEYGFDRDVVAWKGRVRADSAVQDGAAAATLNTPAT